MATNNAINTPLITLGGAFTMSGAYTFTGTITGNTTVTFPTSGTLATVGTPYTFVNQTTSSVTMSPNTVYLTNDSGSLVTYTLPTTAAQGSILQIIGNSADGWSIAQASGQEIFFGTVHTTSGTGGSLSSSNQYDNVTLLCTVANTTWVVSTGPQGNLTYV
jgi:hypothetical protein